MTMTTPDLDLRIAHQGQDSIIVWRCPACRKDVQCRVSNAAETETVRAIQNDPECDPCVSESAG